MRRRQSLLTVAIFIAITFVIGAAHASTSFKGVMDKLKGKQEDKSEPIAKKITMKEVPAKSPAPSFTTTNLEQGELLQGRVWLKDEAKLMTVVEFPDGQVVFFEDGVGTIFAQAPETHFKAMLLGTTLHWFNPMTQQFSPFDSNTMLELQQPLILEAILPSKNVVDDGVGTSSGEEETGSIEKKETPGGLRPGFKLDMEMGGSTNIHDTDGG